MAQSDARFGYQAKMSRSDHDLSQKYGFTCAPGMLLPIWMDFATPGDSYYLKHNLSFMRTAPLLSPSMIDVYVHYETFFVPMQLLYQAFEDTEFSIRNHWSSFFEYNRMRNFRLPTVNYNKLYESIMSSASNVDRFDLQRLLDCFDFNRDVLKLVYNSQGNANWGFPMFPAAYQCIYEYYYRLDDKEDFTQMNFNLDKWYAGDIDYTDSAVQHMFRIQYRAWKFDYYTSSFRSPIVSNASTQAVLPNASYEDLFDGNNITGTSDRDFLNTTGINADGSTLPVTSSGNNNEDIRAFTTNLGVSQNTWSFAIQGAMSTAMIRQMFANEKLAMITGRTKKNYDSQVLAHYGVKVPHDVKHDITLIGQDSFKLEIGEVTSLASTELSPLGELAGKGRAYGNGNRHKFTAPCHGIVMTIFSVEPLKRYHHSSSRLNFMSVSHDLPVPEFERLGNQPMFVREIAPAANSGQEPLHGYPVAWKERYYFSKRKQDRVSLAFMHQPVKIDGSHDAGNLNPYSSFFVSSVPFAYRPSYTESTTNGINPYKISANALDDLMLVPYINLWQNPASGKGDSTTGEDWDAYPYMAYARDPFIVDSEIECKKVSWMSKDGEPIYNY